MRWPKSFLAALGIISAFTFDLSILSGVFCVMRVSFFANLVFATVGLLFVVVGCYSLSKLRPRLRDICAQIAMYLLLFAYPVVSVHIVSVFSCHSVDGTSYLRADYSVGCDSAEWHLMAIWAIFSLFYVVGLPVFVLWTLYRYCTKAKQGRNPENLLYGFLLIDYKSHAPAMLWDGIEMLRKLVLSIIGSFWSSQSPMAIATALLLSVVFLVLHASYWPFKAWELNLLQMNSLIVLSLMYFAGLLLRVNAVGHSDEASLGVMLIVILVMVLLAVICMITTEIWVVHRRVIRKKQLDEKLNQHPEIFNAELDQHLIEYSKLIMGEVLGQGANGQVREAHWEGLQVAVKILQIFEGHGSQDDADFVVEQIEEVKTEATILSRMRHRNIVKFYGVSFMNTEIDFKLCIVIEKCSRSLNDDIYDADVMLSWQQKLLLLLDVAQGMQVECIIHLTCEL